MLLQLKFWGENIQRIITRNSIVHGTPNSSNTSANVFFIIATFIKMEAIVLMVLTTNTVPTSLEHSTIAS